MTMRTYRFYAFLISTVIGAALIGLSFWMRLDVSLVIAALTAYFGYAAVYQHQGTKHDTAVREALIEASGTHLETVRIDEGAKKMAAVIEKINTPALPPETKP